VSGTTEKLKEATMKKIITSCTCIAVFMLLLAPAAFAESQYVDDWIGTWTVTMDNRTKVTWEVTDTWVSESGMSHIAYGVKSPGNVEFQIYYGTFFSKYTYIEASHDLTIWDLPQDPDLSKNYTVLVPNEEFTKFTTEPGPYAIKSGYKGTNKLPCIASYLLGDDDPGLEKLRNYRDTKLAASKVGKNIIKIYYNKSDAIIAVCEKNPVAKGSLKLILESILLVLP